MQHSAARELGSEGPLPEPLMHRRLALPFLLLAPALGAQVAIEPSAFVIRNGHDTLVVERFARTDGTITGRVTAKGQPEFRYRAFLGPGHSVDSMHMGVYAPGVAADAKPLQEARVILRGDSVLIRNTGGGRDFATQPGALPLLNNSYALTELYTERARAHGDSADIPGFALNGGVTLAVAVRPLAADSVVLTVVGQVNRLRVDATGRILGGTMPSAGLVITRVEGAVASRIALGKSDYSAPAGAPYTAREVTVPRDGFTLGGTLTLPSGVTGRVPAVVTITGSGQQDRDEYIAVAGGYRPFRQVADTLGRRGIAVLRLDDRMIGASGGTVGTSADYADDVRAAVAWLREQPEIDPERIALVGHSEGGLIAPMVAATDPRLKGAVLMAGPSQTGRQILTFQQKQAIDLEPSIAPASRDSAYRANMAMTDSSAATNPWLRYFLAYDPLATASRVTTVPILILQGATDHQVTPEQAPALERAFTAAGNRDVTMRVFPELNHLFIHDPSGLPSGYGALTSNLVDPEVLGVLADWLAVRLAR